MKLPEQERFSLEDVAARWKTSVTYVQDLTRRRLLPVRYQLCTDGTPGRKSLFMKMKLFVERKDLEQFEQTAGASKSSWKSLKEARAHFDNVSDKTIRRWIKEKKVESRRGPGNRLQVFCPADL